MAPLGRDLTGRSSSSAAAMAIDRRGPSSPEHAPMPRKPAVRDRKTSLRVRESSQAASWSLLVALDNLAKLLPQAASLSLLVALDNLAKLLPQPDLAPEGALVVDVLIIIVPAPTNVCSHT